MRLLILALTEDCNLRCVYCYARGGERKRYMSYSTAKRAIERHYHPGMKVQLTGGEPLLNYKVVRRVAGRYDVKFSIQTNGTLLDHEKAEELHDLGVRIGISIDGPPEVNDVLRPYPSGRGSTRDVLRAMMVLKSLGIPYGITCVVTRVNQSRLRDLVDIACAFGARSISFDLLKRVGRGRYLSPPDPSSVRDAVLYAERMGYPIRFRNVLQQTLNLRCAALEGKSVFVFPDGREMSACATLASAEIENPESCPFRSQGL
ncbi:Radical SAM superfamily [Geoglobus ahangari]|uniref:Radical SAM superfamily n=1 Tax=Geoglobus ahangari TaxID=113653 RepID=A0A0F7IID7_9EURY|nr:radical SAM protein [Geoglobus ahangari]AKG91738.1 Radical SAM superfamily [Geoglobus ahangari]